MINVDYKVQSFTPFLIRNRHNSHRLLPDWRLCKSLKILVQQWPLGVTPWSPSSLHGGSLNRDKGLKTTVGHMRGKTEQNRSCTASEFEITDNHSGEWHLWRLRRYWCQASWEKLKTPSSILKCKIFEDTEKHVEKDIFFGYCQGCWEGTSLQILSNIQTWYKAFNFFSVV